MSHHPYENLPLTRFWSSGVKTPVRDGALLGIDSLSESLTPGDAIISGGSCFAQYIGKELTARKFNYLRSRHSGNRVESLGLGNIYTIEQLKQWIEFSLGQREWSEQSLFENEGQWFDFLLPHCGPAVSRDAVLEHRRAVSDEILEYLTLADVMIFTIGLTETWKNSSGDVYPACPGTLVGEYDPNEHSYYNCTFQDIHADLEIVEKRLETINPSIRLIYTVSPIPLTATGSDDHVLMATSYSKSVIRAALGQYCQHSMRASYFPSYELINHQTDTDWRFTANLRTVSASGVQYVMAHAFAANDAPEYKQGSSRSSLEEGGTDETVCEEELLDSFSRSADRVSRDSSIVLVGDSHMGKLATAFENSGVQAIGGMVMNGSGFSDRKFTLCEERIFIPQENDSSQVLWRDLHDRMKSLSGNCHIITNIGFQTHRTINHISNHSGTPVLTEADVANYFDEFYGDLTLILKRLSEYGKVWLLEDPNFYTFISGKSEALTVRERNFHHYRTSMRKIASSLGLEYLVPCDLVLQQSFKKTRSLNGLVENDGFHGTTLYYKHCAAVINDTIATHDTAAPLQCS